MGAGTEVGALRGDGASWVKGSAADDEIGERSHSIDGEVGAGLAMVLELATAFKAITERPRGDGVVGECAIGCGRTCGREGTCICVGGCGAGCGAENGEAALSATYVSQY